MTEHDPIAAAPGRWEHFEHVADIGVRGLGATPAEAFEQAACALTAVVTDLARVRLAERVIVWCEAADLELLLVDWLNEVVYQMATRRMLFGRFTVEIAGPHLRGELVGERIDRARHRPAVEVKGATMTALEVRRVEEPEGWLAQCVVDV